jgi:tryptophanyl-tRNA synthetase
MSKDVILTGLRANEQLHIGNYLGAILPMVNLQKKHAGQYQLNMFVPDLHSFTTPIDHGKLYQNTLDNVKVFVAAGLDIDNPDTYVYRQSYIPAHSEMTWILSCFAYFGELNRMTEFKDKSGRKYFSELDLPKRYVISESLLKGGPREHLEKHLINLNKYVDSILKAKVDNISNESNVSSGLFLYPVLMAADILLYGAKYIPVGEDQRQHLEFARDIAMRMNNKFNDLFVVPEPTDKQLKFSGRDNPVRIRSLRNPEKKMSKSVDDPAGTILLSDNPDDAAKKVLGATTDSLASIDFNWEKQPGITNLLQMLALLTDKPQTEVNKEWQDKNSYGELKTAVSEAIRAFLTDFQGKKAQVDESTLTAKLEASEVAMNPVANQTLLKVQKAVGLRPQ